MFNIEHEMDTICLMQNMKQIQHDIYDTRSEYNMF